LLLATDSANLKAMMPETAQSSRDSAGLIFPAQIT